MLLFVGHSLRTMTGSGGPQRAARLAGPGRLATRRRDARRAPASPRQPGVAAGRRRRRPRRSPGSSTRRARPGTIRSGAGSILAVPPGYLAHIHTFRFLRGSLRPGEIVLDQQLAATLQAQPGDTVAADAAARARGRCRSRVSGIALVTAPDVLFQPLNPLLGPAPAQPPANIAILPLATFAATVAPALPSISRGRRRLRRPRRADRDAVAGAGAGRPGGARRGSPAHALAQATQIRNRVERSLPGQVSSSTTSPTR